MILPKIKGKFESSSKYTFSLHGSDTNAESLTIRFMNLVHKLISQNTNIARESKSSRGGNRYEPHILAGAENFFKS